MINIEVSEPVAGVMLKILKQKYSKLSVLSNRVETISIKIAIEELEKRLK